MLCARRIAAEKWDAARAVLRCKRVSHQASKREGGRWLPSAITQPFRNQEAQGKIEYLRKLLYRALRQNVGLSLSDPGLPTTVLTRMMGRKCSEL